MIRHLVLATSLAVAGSAAAAPSFNCAKASTPVEKSICAHPALADQDAAIARQYKETRANLDTEAAKSLTHDQRYFLAVRDNIHANPYTGSSPDKEIGTFMRSRLAFLKSINPQPAAGFVGKWRNIEGEIEITQGADGQLTVAANSAAPYFGRWVCDLSGKAVVSGDSLTVTYQDGPPWVLSLTRRGAVLAAREIPPPGAKEDGFGPPFCGMNGSLGEDWFAVR
ncbi:lysozyme inhibitor LprI family protein [Achromobacter xylosoxidans]|uniref:lysozyme inhibitor LprI family protein n=1 Tax=Alcaligenes xylosoxydans xylosoxydans TaxID=85698 RepID=UPI001F1365CC|nr:lysozyme inhibitor LprI family protein [Achromobacter xylosoxidans]